MHLLLLISKKVLLRVGAKERDALVPKVSKLKTLGDQINTFKNILISEFQVAIRKDTIFMFLTKSQSLKGKTILYTKECPESPENGELNFVGTMVGYDTENQTWSIGLTINSKNVVQQEKVSHLVASVNAKKLIFFDDLV